MSGSNTPRSLKRLRMLFIKMIQEHQSGKSPLPPYLLVKIADRIGVLDGLFPKEVLMLPRDGRSKRLFKSPEPEEIEYDPEVARVMDAVKKNQEETHGDSHRN